MKHPKFTSAVAIGIAALDQRHGRRPGGTDSALRP